MKNIGKLRKLMSEKSLSALVVVPGPNMSYLTGSKFHLSERPVVLILEQERATFILPELESSKVSNLEIELITYNDETGPDPAFIEFSNKSRFTEVGIESRTIRHLELDLLQKTEISKSFVDAIDIFATLRMSKSNQEKKMMMNAVDIAQKSLESIMEKIRLGVTEKEFASELVIQLLKNGSESELPFSPIVASGVNAANPHHFPIDKEFEKGDLIIIDWGANYEGYFSDITRTFAIGNDIDSRLLDAYEAVKEANLAARGLAKSGVKAGLLDKAAREVIVDAGFGQYFTHRTGHGLGLEIHEEPYIKPNNKFVLQKGMTFTIEPGIYIPDLGGIRIEDDIYLEDQEAISLTSLTRELIFL